MISEALDIDLQKEIEMARIELNNFPNDTQAEKLNLELSKIKI